MGCLVLIFFVLSFIALVFGAHTLAVIGFALTIMFGIFMMGRDDYV